MLTLRTIQVPGVLVSTWCAEPVNLALAAAWYLEEPPLRQGLVYLQQYWHEAGGYPTTVDATRQCRVYLKHALEELAPGDAVLAAELLGRLALKLEDFTEALHWFRVSVGHFGATLYHPWRDLLIAAHHAAQDEIFDEVIQSFPLENKQFWECADIMFHVAENQMARRHFAEALQYNEKACAFHWKAGRTEDDVPVLIGQRAMIFQGLGSVAEAERDWDRALLGYEAQGNRGGVAECYHELGRLAARNGRVGLGISLVQQAISTFEETGNIGAVAATQGTLGDIFLECGQREKARTLFEKGLAF